MLRSIVIKDQKIPINASSVLGTGGEGVVVQVDNMAVKLYHQPDTQRINKIQSFFSNHIILPDSVCSPQILVYDSTGKKIVGFAMRMLSSRQEPLQKLSSKSFRQSNPHITNRFITDLFIDAYKTTQECHKSNVIIGDYNDLNIVFSRNCTFTDADSFQFGGFPCMVGTEQFLDPTLYDIDLSQRPYFKPINDWYSWFCIFIKSLLMVHPYGGSHPDYATVPQRASAKITIFDNKVKYPKIGANPDILDNNLRLEFEKIFKHGERHLFPIELINNYRESLVDCKSCKTCYPSERTNCPHCATINIIKVPKTAPAIDKQGHITSETLLKTQGDILWFKIFDESLYVVSLENNKYVLYWKTSLKSENNKSILFTKTTESIPKFDIFANKYFVFNTHPESQRLHIFNIFNRQLAGESHASFYQGESVFACDRHSLLRVYNDQLYRTTYSEQFNRLLNESVCNVIENQTWISTGTLSTNSSNVLFGFQRAFGVIQYFYYLFDNDKKLYYSVRADDLEQNESIIDYSIKTYKYRILLMLKTEIRGKTYTRVYIIERDKILCHYKTPSLSTPTHRDIHHQAFAYSGNNIGTILHVLDDIIVQENITQPDTMGTLVNISALGEVNDCDYISQYKNGICILHDNAIKHLQFS